MPAGASELHSDAPPPVPASRPPLTAEERRKIVDDPKLGDVLKTIGGTIKDIK